MGSEPGMGWNWCVNLANHCELYIITEGEFRDKIEAEVSKLLQGKNMHFYYNPLPDKVRQMCWNQGDWRFYWYYRKWQKKTLEIARGIIAEHHIDVLHQLNMIGFREPGYLWKIEDIPFVWGPIGGMELMPTAYLKGAGWKVNFKNRAKNLINSWQMNHQPRVLKAISRANMLVAATEGAYKVLHEYHKKENVVLINETGCYANSTPPRLTHYNSHNLRILWVGKFDFRKQLALAIKTIAKMKNRSDVRLQVVGESREEIVRPYQELAAKIGVIENIEWRGKVSHDEVLKLMRSSDVFLFTSINEGTPHVVLEAIQENLPVVCFNTCGQGSVVDETIGGKVELSDPGNSAAQLAAILDRANSHREELYQMKENCYTKSSEMTWESKAIQMVELYEKIRYEK